MRFAGKPRVTAGLPQGPQRSGINLSVICYSSSQPRLS